MNFLVTLLGKLPASDSLPGKLNSLDWMKIARMADIVFLGTFCTQVGATTLTDANLNQVLLDAANAGVMAVSTAVAETARRSRRL